MADSDLLDKKCHRLVDEGLTEEEQEQAARTSYRYFRKSLLLPPPSADADSIIIVNDRKVHARKMARRHIIAEKGNETKALIKLKATLKWREEMQMDEMRQCFDDISNVDENDIKKLLHQNLRKGLHDQMEERGKCYLRGYDKEGRAIYFFQMHHYTNFDDNTYYHQFHFYLMDRAIAATERETNQEQESLIVVMDYSQYSRHNFIPLRLAKQFLTLYGAHWPESLHAIYVLDTPLLFRAFWILIKPFIDPATKKKINFVTGQAAKEAVLSECMDASQASPCMLENAGMTRPFDKQEFFEQIPYDHIFDEEKAITN